jgi:hypothetical protein
MSSPRKFISEFGLHVCTSYGWLLQQDGLSKLSELPDDPHIYIVGRRPRISIDPRSVVITSDTISGRCFKHVRDEKIDIPFTARNELGCAELSVQSSYPYTEVSFVASDGKPRLSAKSAMLLGLCGPEYWNHLDLEVLYVGQSYGEGGSRTAVQRLQSHSTLQSIYAEAIRQSPDQEIWLVLLCFERYMLASFDGVTKNYQTTEEEDESHRRSVIYNPVSEQQEVNFTEGALIKYFRPDFNIKYKDSFPSPAHATYEQCYAIDLNAVAVEVQTEDLMLRLWSPTVAPQWTHLAKYPLHSEQHRRSMFDLV